jgi:hypothetical protein
MVMRMTEDEQREMMRRAVVDVIGQHIDARLKQAGRRLVTGSTRGYAEALVKPWDDGKLLAFYTLGRGGDGFHKSKSLARKCGMTFAAFRAWWKRLRSQTVPVRPSEGASLVQSKLAIFRDGHEAFYSDGGIKLQLNASMLRFDEARRITDSQAEATRVAKANYEGAAVAQEADASRTEEERTVARRRLEENRDEVVVPGQAGLFDLAANE